MVDIGTAPNSTNVAKVIVHPDFPNTLVVIGADQGPGTANGPARKVAIFEDLTLRGNLDAGSIRGARFELHDGGTVPHMTGVPRISTEVAISEMSLIGAGRVDIPNARLVKVYDNLTVAHNLTVVGTASLNGGATVTGDLSTTGDVDAGSVGAWSTVRSKNMVYASGTFHMYDRGSGVQVKQCTGFGFDVSPINFGVNTNFTPLLTLPAAMVRLDAPVAQMVVHVTAWQLGQYDETVAVGIIPPLMIPLVGATSLIANVNLKGTANVSGGTPASSVSAQQVEITFWNTFTGAPFTPAAGSPAQDVVFDLTVVGYPVA